MSTALWEIGAQGYAAAAPVPDRAQVLSWSGSPLVIAHRGASAIAPENTIPAMTAAVRAGADMAEFDVQRTADGKLIVVHDATFARTTNVAQVFPGRENDPVGSFTWTEVKQLDAGSWFGPGFAGTRVPSLAALLRSLRPTRMRLLLELKNPDLYGGYERQVARQLDADGYVDSGRVWVHSFGVSSLRTFHALAPTVPVGLISETGTVAASDVPWLNTANLMSSVATDANIDAATREGLHVLSWPSGGKVENVSEVDRLLDDGVAGLITDRPVLTRQLIGRDQT